MPEAPLAVESAKARAASFPQLQNEPPKKIAQFWLSNSVARGLLNEQLAMLLRIALEERTRSDELPFCFCPICGSLLSEYQQENAWERGLRCSRDHRWGERNGLGGMVGNVRLRLSREPSEDTVRHLAQAWLTRGDPEMRLRLHDSVRDVLARSYFGNRVDA